MKYHMPPIKHDDEDRSQETDQSCPPPYRPSSEGAPLIPWEQSWALSGCITWRHQNQPLLTIPFVYAPTPFLPGATTIPDPSPHQPFHPAPPQIETKRSLLPDLPPQDSWVVVDGRWNYQMLGWRKREERVGSYGRKVKYAVAVSGLAIDVGNLRPDPDDPGHLRLLHFLYRHFRPAGIIHDIWVPAGQEGMDSLKAVVMFNREYEVRNALMIPDREFFFNGIARTISVDRHETRHWYPAPRSRVKALHAHALKTKETCINSLKTLDPFLGTILTHWYSGQRPTKEPPCLYRLFYKMPEEYHPPLYFGLDGLEPIDSPVEPTLPGPHATPLPYPDSDIHNLRAAFPSQGLSSSPSLSSVALDPSVLGTIGRLPNIVVPSSKDRYYLEPDKEPNSSSELHPAKRQRMDNTKDGTAKHSCQNVVPDANSIPNGRTKRETLTQMAMARTERLKAGSGTVKNLRKRKAGELEDEEDGSESDSDMDMDIDD